MVWADLSGQAKASIQPLYKSMKDMIYRFPLNEVGKDQISLIPTLQKQKGLISISCLGYFGCLELLS